MKTLLKSLKYYALIPLIASIPGLALTLCGSFGMKASVVAVPLVTALIYILFRKKIDMNFSAKTNGIIFLALLVIFTGMMVVADGNVESLMMSYFSFLILPFFPIMIIMALTGEFMLLYAGALLSYLTAFIVSAFFAKISKKIYILPGIVGAICIAANIALYINSPTVKYAGHGFDYMHGYSSTDFTDYTVYADHSKLAGLDHKPSFMIENEDEMPVLDGAEACYPLYAAFAKALYKDIDQIETKYLDTDAAFTNGKIVTMTNTIYGFERLMDRDAEKFGKRVDMFFGARPSASQMEAAKENGVELDITPIGKEAFVFFVEEDNPIENLTSEQLKAIYHGDIKNWSELGGKDQEILAFQRPKNSGSQTMMEYFMGDVSLKAPQTYEKVDAMAGVIKEVAQYANEKGAIGYSFRYFLEELGQEEKVKMLSIDGVYPTLDNIEHGSYPLTTNVCLVTRKNELNPNVQKMIDFILSDDGQEIVRKTGYAGLAEYDQ
ncbi:MAG: substrate-binding domain-containing protein [Oscillospiraceae bacterium]|nr:substrate-binding domain-containing protein [Oscillospiraceae bacterium]